MTIYPSLMRKVLVYACSPSLLIALTLKSSAVWTNILHDYFIYSSLNIQWHILVDIQKIDQLVNYIIKCLLLRCIRHFHGAQIYSHSSLLYGIFHLFPRPPCYESFNLVSSSLIMQPNCLLLIMINADPHFWPST